MIIQPSNFDSTRKITINPRRLEEGYFIEFNYKKFSLGFSSRYNSFIANIDKMFEVDAFGTEILPGLKEYREEYNKGNFVVDSRVAYYVSDKIRVSFIANNVLNAEYSSRPGDIQAPRNFILQLQMKF